MLPWDGPIWTISRNESCHFHAKTLNNKYISSISLFLQRHWRSCVPDSITKDERDLHKSHWTLHNWEINSYFAKTLRLGDVEINFKIWTLKQYHSIAYFILIWEYEKFKLMSVMRWFNNVLICFFLILKIRRLNWKQKTLR